MTIAPAAALKKYNFNTAWGGRISERNQRYLMDGQTLIDTEHPCLDNRALLEKLLDGPTFRDRSNVTGSIRFYTEKRIRDGMDEWWRDAELVPSGEHGYLSVVTAYSPSGLRCVALRSFDGETVRTISAHKYKLVKALFRNRPDFKVEIGKVPSIPVRIEMKGLFAAAIAGRMDDETAVNSALEENGGGK